MQQTVAALDAKPLLDAQSIREGARRQLQNGAVTPNYGVSHAEYGEGNRLAEIVRDALVTERVAVESYREMVRYVGDGDPTTVSLHEAARTLRDLS